MPMHRKTAETPAASDHQAETITRLCDRLQRINHIATFGGPGRGTHAARLAEVRELSEGFLPVPPCPSCGQSHAEPECAPATPTWFDAGCVHGFENGDCGPCMHARIEQLQRDLKRVAGERDMLALLHYGAPAAEPETPK